MSEFNIMKNWFCRSCNTFFDLHDKNTDLKSVVCPNCHSQSIYNGDFLAIARQKKKSLDDIHKICDLYDEIIKEKDIKNIILKLNSIVQDKPLLVYYIRRPADNEFEMLTD